MSDKEKKVADEEEVKVDAEAETETPEEKDGEEEEEVKESVEEAQSFDGLFEGSELSEDFKRRAKLVFEAAVQEQVEALVAEAAKDLEEEYDAKMTEAVSEAIDGVTESVETYLDYVVKEWVAENAVAIESGIKVEMAESLMEGMKELFYTHNIKIDEETIDVVADLEEEVSGGKERINTLVAEKIELEKEVASMKAEKVFEEISEGMSASKIERLRKISEKLDHSDMDAYREDLNSLKENFFADKAEKAAHKAVDITEEDEGKEIVTEEVVEKATDVTADPIRALAESISRKK